MKKPKEKAMEDKIKIPIGMKKITKYLESIYGPCKHVDTVEEYKLYIYRFKDDDQMVLFADSNEEENRLLSLYYNIDPIKNYGIRIQNSNIRLDWDQ